MTYLGRDDLAHVPAEEILTRKLRPSEKKEEEEKDPTKRQQMKQPQPKPKTESVSDGQATQKAPTETDGDYESDYERAKQLGYTGDSCPECGSMTMIRNGTCQKCITCGATTGCS